MAKSLLLSALKTGICLLLINTIISEQLAVLLIITILALAMLARTPAMNHTTSFMVVVVKPQGMKLIQTILLIQQLMDTYGLQIVTAPPMDKVPMCILVAYIIVLRPQAITNIMV